MIRILNYFKRYNLITLFLYLYYEFKILFRGIVFASYSQNGEDLYIIKYFKNKKKGFYVDIGAYHPKRFSNTYLLKHNNWSGVNIEANPNLIKKFLIDRPNDINLNIGVSDKKDKLKFYVFEPLTLSTFSERMKDSYLNQKYKLIKTLNIDVLPLDQILNEYCKNKVIDLLTIDVEGYEIEVLSGLKKVSNLPKLLCIESIDHNQDDTKKLQKIISFLDNLSYKKIKQIGVNSIFEKKI